MFIIDYICFWHPEKLNWFGKLFFFLFFEKSEYRIIVKMKSFKFDIVLISNSVIETCLGRVTIHWRTEFCKKKIIIEKNINEQNIWCKLLAKKLFVIIYYTLNYLVIPLSLITNIKIFKKFDFKRHITSKIYLNAISCIVFMKIIYNTYLTSFT